MTDNLYREKMEPLFILETLTPNIFRYYKKFPIEVTEVWANIFNNRDMGYDGKRSI